jgi:hypothetical protein
MSDLAELCVRVKCPDTHQEWLAMRREVEVWIANHARGGIKVSNIYCSKTDTWTDLYTFTDKDTAFWFKVSFQ